MKIITLTQPWATLVAIGAKKIETRSWNTSYRGPLGIHAAKGFPKDAQAICYDPVFSRALAYAGIYRIDELPLGVILAVTELVETVRITGSMNPPDRPECFFGNYAVGRCMWYLGNVVKFDKPIPAKGALSLWDFDIQWPVPSDILDVSRWESSNGS